ncbi:unnamed protein product [Paramecium pentaurelia]|uniref:Phospholipid-transporting ATPase n=1 Tax=Paramecium pentaurelia TaxID=43138 RepID=A0A8S1UES2_9CILI|nr:unnamed protein product [Paramecium pentaurelia]
MKNTFFHKIKRFFRGSPNEWKNLPKRVIHPGQADILLPNNKVITSKYTIFTFLPLNMVEQFSKMANIYFLIVGILQMIPAITVSDGLPTEYTPLVVIVIATAIKDLLEDLQRHKADRKENNTIISGKKSQEIRVGEYIRINPNEQIPADILLLNQECFVETSQLDGETTLKPKQPIIENIEFIEAAGPNPYLYQFSGSINGQKPLNEHNLLLRGSCLKSLDPIDGIVIYTGHQTKILLNSHNPRGKVTKMQQVMNRLILYLFIGQWLLCIFCASYFTIALSIKKQDLDYLYLNQPEVTALLYFSSFCQSVGNWFLLFVNFVPISLMLTLEMIRLFQAYFIIKDPEMGQNTKVQSSNLNDDLGQINHIFSDKTGTLTANQMTLRQYIFKNQNIDLQREDSQLIFNEENIIYLLQFILCNDIKVKNGNVLSSSSDEMALINYFLNQGLQIAEDGKNYLININNEIYYRIEKVYLIPFSSDRKRMSIVLRFQEKLYIFCKGADSVIVSRTQSSTNYQDNILSSSQTFANQGLRVLLFSYKELDESEFAEWLEIYEKTMIQQDEQMLDKLQNQLETNLILSGASGVEDILSEHVQETIVELQYANIQIWMITGDAYATAKGVAQKIGLMTLRSKSILVEHQTISEIESLVFDSEKNISNQYDISLVILGKILIDYTMEDKFRLIKLAKECQCVIFSRVSPKQKREIVELFQKCFPNLCTLAIGDGANDVNMITEANVGIGVCGVEGLQAARASDYAIPLFKCLQQLLLFHGRECYRRNTQVVTYNFYKNVLYLIPQFWFGLYSQFSAQSIYDFYVFQCYNFMFTSLPIIVYGVFDIKFNDTMPNKYKFGQEGRYLNFKVFILSLLEGVYQSLIIFFFCFYFLNTSSSNGFEYGLLVQGQIIFFICIIVANTKILLLSHQIQVLQIIIQILSYVSYICTILIFNNVVEYQLYGVLQEILTQGITYIIVLLVSYLSISVIIYQKKYQLFKKLKKAQVSQSTAINASLITL